MTIANNDMAIPKPTSTTATTTTKKSHRQRQRRRKRDDNSNDNDKENDTTTTVASARACMPADSNPYTAFFLPFLLLALSLSYVLSSSLSLIFGANSGAVLSLCTASQGRNLYGIDQTG